jgi:tetratricopeptide (TPR) repeat protein
MNRYLLTFASMSAFALTCLAGEMTLSLDSIIDGDALPAALVKSANQAYAFNMHGLDLLDSNDLDGALGQFDKALAIFSDYTDAENNRGVVFYRKGMIGRAQEIWQNVVRKSPDYAVGFYNLGIIANHANDPTVALKHFQQAVKLNNRFVEGMVFVGKLLMVRGDRNAGLESLKSAYTINPKDKAAWGSYAVGLLTAADTASAEAILQKHADNADALTMLGKIQAAKRNFVKAADYFGQAVARGGTPDLLIDRASMLLDAGKCQEAMTALQSYFARNPKPDADALVLAGIAAKECKDLKSAQDYFQKGVERFPQDPILRYNLGQIFYHQKQYVKAEELWSTIADSLDDPSLFYSRAMAARHEKRLTQAEQLVRKAIALDKKAEYYDLLGVILFANGKRAEATDNFKQALKIDPSSSSARMNLALLDQSPAALKQSIAVVKAACDTCVEECTDCALRLAVLYYQDRQIDNAIAVIERIPPEQRNETVIRHAAVFYREKQAWNKAIEILEYAKKNLVLEPQTEYELAENYLAAGVYDKAIEILKGLVTRWPQKPWRIFYQIGYAAMESNDLALAQEYFERSLKEKADNVAARGLLAFVLNRQGKSDQARSLWEKNLKDDPDNPVMWINMGLLDENQGRFQEALNKYQQAGRLQPDNKEISINIGNALASLQRNREAKECYTRALTSPKRELAAYNLMLVAQKTGDREGVEKMFDILKNEFPGSAYTRRAISEVALVKGDTAQAVEILEKMADKTENDWFSLASIYYARKMDVQARGAIQHIPDVPAWQTARRQLEASAAFYQGRYDEAYTLWKEVKDSTFYTLFNLAVAAYHNQRYRETIGIAEPLVANAVGGDRGKLCRLIGNAAFQLKDWALARSWYLQLSGLESQNAVVQYNLAVAAYNLNDEAEAWKYYQSSRELDPSLSNKDIEKRHAVQSGQGSVVGGDSLDMWYNAAIDLQDSGRDSAAETLYVRVLALDSNRVQAWNNLGAIYAGRAELDRAAACYQKSLARRHDLPEAYANLVNVYIAMEDFDSARKWLFKGTFHNPDNETLKVLGDTIAAMQKRGGKPGAAAQGR